LDGFLEEGCLISSSLYSSERSDDDYSSGLSASSTATSSSSSDSDGVGIFYFLSFFPIANIIYQY
jgi:hypothetical protein